MKKFFLEMNFEKEFVNLIFFYENQFQTKKEIHKRTYSISCSKRYDVDEDAKIYYECILLVYIGNDPRLGNIPYNDSEDDGCSRVEVLVEDKTKPQDSG